MTNTTEELAAHLRAEFARRKIPNTQIAERLGITQTAVSRRMLGQTPIDVPELYELADLLGMPVADLLPERASA